ncbi:MFS transporter [Heyndrickxia oleronia]|uniref:MFS transporter n=1 Tax=Heyndrickxia oleronia TaxID=38875 RepID=A0AAW6SZF8_9BACI|nr:MFS transporter [Heyndrickxia oleronia]MCM3238283.1 MFS transporter [Heyndrickxia oleronia]MDH5161361.1 MFS transporter [Heyndrickxia oleronia]
MDTEVLRKKDDYVKTKFKIPYWWKVVLAFSLGWMFINANKYFLNPILDNIGLEYHLNNSQLGLVNSIFFLTYTIAQIPAGSFSDKFGRKKLLVIGFILYGVLTGISGLMAGFTGFLVARAVAGLASATYYGPQFALSSEAIPAKNRTVGSAIINSGSGIGIALGFILSSTLVLDMGMSWRIPFYIFGVLTVLIGIFISLMVKEKKDMKEAPPIGTAESEEKVSVLSLLKNRNLLVVFLVLFCSIYGFTVVVTWLPKFLLTERGFVGSEVGLISALVPLTAIPGALLFSYLTDKWGKKKPFAFILIPIAAIALWATVYVKSVPLLIIALVIYGLFGKIALDPLLIAAVSENVKQKNYGVAFSLYNFMGMLSSVIAPFFTGLLADLTGSMASGFYSAVIILILGLVIMMFFKEGKKNIRV